MRLSEADWIRIRRRLTDFWSALVRLMYVCAVSPFMAMFLSVLAILIGVAGAVAANDLSCAWPLSSIWAMPTACHGQAVSFFGNGALVLFWGSIIVFGPLFFGRELAVVTKAKSERIELLYTVRTMPPPSVLEAFHAAYVNVIEFVERHLKETYPSPEENLAAIERGIRLCLANLEGIARSFQRSGEPTRYAANVMIYRQVASIPKDQNDRILDALMPYLEQRSFQGLRGILYLERNLSVSSDGTADSLAVDPLLTGELALPVPEQIYNERVGFPKRPRFLPGGVTALVDGNYIVDDTRDLLKRYRENQELWDLPLTIMENIDKYFRQDPMGKLVRSFVSIQIKESERKDASSVGVVNIHCSRPNIFRDEWVYKSFLALSTPVVVQISGLLQERGKLA